MTKPQTTAVGVVLALALGGFAVVSVAALVYPFDLDMREGILFLPALRLLAGHPIYGEEAALTPPFVVAHYGPLYYATLGVALSVTGVAFWPGRLLSILSTASIAVGLFKLATRQRATFVAALFAAAVFLTLPGIWAFGTLQRVDLPALALSFLGIRQALWGAARPAATIAGGVLTAASLLVKPSLVCAPAAIVFAFLLSGRAGTAALFLCGLLGTLGSALVLVGLSGAGDVWYTLQIVASGPYSTADSAAIALTAVTSPIFVLATLSWLLQAPAHWRSLRSARPAFLLVYPVLSGVVGLAASQRAGGSINYLFELLLALSLCLAVWEGGCLPDPGATGRRALLLGVMLCDLIVLHGGFARGRFVIPYRKAPMFRAVIERLRQLPPQAGPVFSSYPDLALRAGREPFFQTPGAFSVGPPELRRALEAFQAERSAAAIVLDQLDDEPGYRLVEIGRYVQEPWGRTIHMAGPFLFVREGLVAEASAR